MKRINIILDVKESYVKEEITRELSWYDTIKKEMVEMQGGQLQYKYQEDPYLVAMSEEERAAKNIKSTWRVLPVASPLKVVNYNKTKRTSNKNVVLKVCEDFQNYNEPINIAAETDFEMIVICQDSDADDFCYDLERNGIRFFINEIE